MTTETKISEDELRAAIKAAAAPMIARREMFTAVALVQQVRDTVPGLDDEYDWEHQRAAQWPSNPLRPVVEALAEKTVNAYLELHNRETAPLPEAQLRVALALAHAYGHGWAGCEGDTIAAIREARRAQSPDWPGISAPDMDGHWHLVHTSGTGRLSWSIAPDGAVVFEIHRPGGDTVLSAIVSPVNYEVPDAWATGEGEYHQRHVVALMEAVSAVAYYKLNAFCACAPLWAGAVEDEPAEVAQGGGWGGTHDFDDMDDETPLAASIAPCAFELPPAVED